MELTKLFLLMLASVAWADSKPVDPIIFLHKYGYLQPGRSGGKNLFDAIKQFQLFAGLKVTATLTTATVKKMKEPRCGVKDIGLALGSKWNHNDLKYRIASYPRTPSQSVVRKVLKKAFGIWEQVSALTFTEVAGSEAPDFTIDFFRLSHGDQYPFDGVTGVLGHAFFPSDGRIHFDYDENFTDGSDNGTNLLWLAVHEIGHAVGLSHSKNHKSLMSPYFSPKHNQPGLPSVDASEIQAAYGRPTNGCANKLKDCVEFKKQGFCKRYVKETQYWCAKACKWCQ